MNNSEKKYQGHIALLAANIIWGMNMPIAKSIMPDFVSPGALNYFRMLGAAIMFWLASIFIRQEKVAKQDLIKLAFAAFFGIVANQVLFLRGLSMTAPTHAAIIATLAPVITMIISAIYLKEPVTWLKSIGVMVGMSGAILLIFSGTSGESATGNIWGDLLCVLSGTSYAIYLVVFKRVISRYNAVTIMKWMFLFATLLCTPVFYSDMLHVNYSILGFSEWWRISFVVLGATFFSYLMVPIGQRNLRPTTMSMYNYLQPLVASILAVIWGMDSFGITQIIAGTLVFSGVYIVTRSKSKAQMLPENRKECLK